MIRWKKASAAISALLLFAISATGQQPQYEAVLNKIPRDGFYKIVLTPEVMGRSSFGDQRIIDEDGRQVPYNFDFWGASDVSGGKMIEHRFSIVNQGVGADKQAFVVLENTGHISFDQLEVSIRNTGVFRTMTVSGSDEQVNWYAIREDFVWVRDALVAGDNSRKLYLSLPTTDYRFIRITFNGKDKLPVKVLSAVYLGSGTVKEDYLPVPSPSFVQKDSNKRTYVTFKFDHPYYTQKMEFEVEGPKYFHRFAYISTNGRSYMNDMSDWRGTYLSSGQQTIYQGFKGDEIRLLIENEDSPPLRIKGLRAYQGKIFLTAYLEANKSYKLTFGDSTAQMPTYDLQYFKDSIANKQIPELGVGKIKTVSRKAISARQPERKWLIWAALTGLLGVLSFVTYKMMQRLKTDNQSPIS